MSARNARRLLLAAFALSILLHLFGMRFVRWGIPAPAEVPDVAITQHIAITHIPKRTPPPQTPQPVPTGTPAQQNTHKVAVQVPHITSRNGPSVLPRGGPVATPVPTPHIAATHLPTPNPHGPCTSPEAPAAVRTMPSPPDIPNEARKEAKTGVVQVRVGLSDTGAVQGTTVENSSGSTALDQVAVELAKGSTYSAQLAQCKPVAGSYVFRVRFSTP